MLKQQSCRPTTPQAASRQMHLIGGCRATDPQGCSGLCSLHKMLHCSPPCWTSVKCASGNPGQGLLQHQHWPSSDCPPHQDPATIQLQQGIPTTDNQHRSPASCCTEDATDGHPTEPCHICIGHLLSLSLTTCSHRMPVRQSNSGTNTNSGKSMHAIQMLQLKCTQFCGAGPSFAA